MLREIREEIMIFKCLPTDILSNRTNGASLIITLVTQRQPTHLTATNAVEINRWEYAVNTCLGTTDPWQVFPRQVFPRQVFTPYGCLDFSSVCCFCHVGCLWITGVVMTLFNHICGQLLAETCQYKNIH